MINPLSVTENHERKRLILDLSFLNNSRPSCYCLNTVLFLNLHTSFTWILSEPLFFQFSKKKNYRLDILFKTNPMIVNLT